MQGARWRGHLIERVARTALALLAAAVVLAGASHAEAIKSFCKGKPFETNSEICCGGKISLKGGANSCCGTTPIDIKFQMCCSNVVQQKASNFSSCCGKSAVDLRTNLCCGNVVHPKGVETSCCGSTPYNPKMALCCKGKVRPMGQKC